MHTNNCPPQPKLDQADHSDMINGLQDLKKCPRSRKVPKRKKYPRSGKVSKTKRASEVSKSAKDQKSVQDLKKTEKSLGSDGYLISVRVFHRCRPVGSRHSR